MQIVGFGLSAIDDIDPNPDNFVSAGIVNTQSVLVGCLLRLEPNKQTKVCMCVYVCTVLLVCVRVCLYSTAHVCVILAADVSIDIANIQRNRFQGIL